MLILAHERGGHILSEILHDLAEATTKIRQTGGPLLVASAPGQGDGGGAPAAEPPVDVSAPGALPATGGGAVAGLLLVGVAAVVRRRRAA